ncbi:MAG: hypothetical protein JXA28_10815 [Bacteroidetes bacterium]|nr:hypothetical protein [Bacteroidota bacterium]
MSFDTQTLEIREIILDRIANILQDVYQEPVLELTEESIIAKLAFKGDPQLNELRLALDRIRRGEYGRCIFCKCSIDGELLRRSPTTHFCSRCANILRYRTSGVQS